MQYTMYYEEQQKIDYDEYGKLKQQLLQKEENQKFEKYTLRKLKFRGDVSNEAVPHYYLCVKNQDEDAIYLEKKYMQMHIWQKVMWPLLKKSDVWSADGVTCSGRKL